ncbi:MAG TPA: ABC transporter permease subunit [Candidatus Limnocylindrales bacterium]|nr:ABC transporter permease subunit [Candidatus Limnocylindrales bacterium]
MSAFAARFPSLRRPLPRLRRFRPSSGITAILVKELRGRMRGRRAFIILTIHILLLAVFAWMFERINEDNVARMGSYGGQATFGSAMVGRGVFSGLMMLQTLMIAVLAPAATAGAISSEREHQTLELLTVTPISSIAIVVGKLFSALAWVFVLILASIPVTALVFVFGGVAPDDVIRGYAVLLATAIGLGSIGIFFSALTRRTGASTGLTFVATLVLMVGSVFVFFFMATTNDVGSNGLRKMPSQSILWLNPFVAQADVACGTEDGTSYDGYCGFMSNILGLTGQDFGQPPQFDPGVPVPCCTGGGVIGGVAQPNLMPVIRKDAVNIGGDGLGGAPGGVINGDVVINSLSFRDRFWPKTVISFLVLAIVLTLASIQFVSPTRRWRPSLPGPVRRLIRRRSAT